MLIRMVAEILVRVDEEAYMQDVGRLWEDHFERGALEPSLPCGYGKCTDAVERIIYDLAAGMRLGVETCTYTDIAITLDSGCEEQYQAYEEKLKQRIAEARLSEWAQVQL